MTAGCAAPAGHIRAGAARKISNDMTKEQVIKQLGRPDNIAAEGQCETFRYVLHRPWWQHLPPLIETQPENGPFYVKIVDGKVASYGASDQ